MKLISGWIRKMVAKPTDDSSFGAVQNGKS
jgi:hypothetical protein